MRYDLSVLAPFYLVFLGGLINTLLYSAVSIVLALIVGFSAALGKSSNSILLRSIATIYVEIFRNTPFLVQVFVFYYVLPQFELALPVALAGILALSLFTGAYMCESIRGAVDAVPKGQVDAARASGMSHLRCLYRVVAPQMIRYLLPPLTNNMIGAVKDSAILSIITVPELTMATQIAVGETFGAMEAFTVSAILYWLVCGAIELGMQRLQRASYHHRLYPV